MIQASSGLKKEEVEKLVRDAEANAEEDRRKKEEVEIRNTGDTLAYNTEKMLREQGQLVPADLKTEVEGKIAAVRSALQGSDTAAMRRAVEELQESTQKVGQHVYSQTKAPGGGGPGGPQGPAPGPEGKGGGPDTVEGEFREV